MEIYNLLPLVCEPSIWHDVFRDEQNHSSEFDYGEVNGCLGDSTFLVGVSDSTMPYGSKLRLLGIGPGPGPGPVDDCPF